MATEHFHRRIAAATGIVMASVLLSRIIGFFRDWTVAHQIGSNAATDTFYAAFTLPDFLNYLIAGGSLSITFIPVFSKYVAEKREDEGWHVFSTVVTIMSCALVVLICAAEIFAPQLVRFIAPGFSPEERSRVIMLTRLMLPAQFCFYQGSILSAVQYAKNQFVIPSLAPIIYNIGIILGGVLLSPRIGVTGFAVGVLGGAVVGNFLLQIYGAHRAGAKFIPNFNARHPGFWMFLKLSVPIMLALSLTFVDDWIIRWFGSYLQPGSITWLNYGKTLMRVPLGLVGQAIGVASFPILAQLYSEKRFDDLNALLNSTFKALIFLLVPISALTIAQSVPILYLVFSHTRLHGPDIAATAAALAVFSIGMFAWGAQNILSRGFYAARDTMTPAIVGTIVTVISLPLYWILVRHMAYLGLALASSAGIVVYTVTLFLLLNRRTKNSAQPALIKFFLKVTLASAAMGYICYRTADYLERFFDLRRFGSSFAVLVVVSGLGLGLLWVFLRLLGVTEVSAYLSRAVQFISRKRTPTNIDAPAA